DSPLPMRWTSSLRAIKPPVVDLAARARRRASTVAVAFA
ncbi:unnamed protein product, partial [Tilletia laevis]